MTPVYPEGRGRNR